MADSSFYEALFYLILGVVLDRTLGRGIDWVVTKVMKKVEARVDDPRHLLWKLIIQPPANVAGLLLSFFALVWLVFPVWGLLTQTVPNPGTIPLAIALVIWWLIGLGMLRLSVMLIRFRIKKRRVYVDLGYFRKQT